MDKYEQMEEDFQAEKRCDSKQEYAQKMHNKELAKMSQGDTKDPVSSWSFLNYCREYQAKVDAHNAKKRA